MLMRFFGEMPSYRLADLPCSFMLFGTFQDGTGLSGLIYFELKRRQEIRSEPIYQGMIPV